MSERDSDWSEIRMFQIASRTGWGKAALVGAVSVGVWLFSTGFAAAQYAKITDVTAAKVEIGVKLDELAKDNRRLSEELTRVKTLLEERLPPKK
jgi:hypothetical protein